MAIMLVAGSRAAAGDAIDLLRARDGELRGYVDLNYHNAPLQRVLFDLQAARPGTDIAVRAENVGAEQDLLAERLSVGPLRGLAWNDAVRYVAGKMGLLADMTREDDGLVSLEKTPRFSGVFDGVRLGDAIRLITEKARANVVVSPRVDADEAVHLTFADVPWREALRSVLKAHGCVMEIDAGVVRVLTSAEAPVRTETVPRPLKYLRPGAPDGGLAPLLDALGHIAPDNGGVTHDPRTNTLLLTGTAEKLAEMARVVDAVDVAPHQVAIETSLIDMEMDPGEIVAANWLVRNAPAGRGDAAWEAVCSVHGDNCATVSASLSEPAAPEYSVGTLSPAEAAAVLRASLHSDAVAVTQAPQMTVVDRETASVSVGTTRPGGSPASAQEALFSGVRLTMTPRVCGDGDQVMLEICYEQHGPPASPSCGGAVRVVRTRMLLHSGETGVIAGLMREGAGKGGARRFGGRGKEAKPSRVHSVIMVTPILVAPPDDTKFEKGVEALRASLALAGS